jgi:hypothetical protein
MKQADIEGLRSTLNALPADSKALERKEITRMVSALGGDILAARARGVTWASIIKALSEGAGIKLSADRIRPLLRPPAEPPPPAPVPEQKKYQKKATDGRDFIIAAITPDGALYQLERGGGGYAVHEVDAGGNLRVCTGAKFPRPAAGKEDAICRFREWARDKGYEIYGG